MQVMGTATRSEATGGTGVPPVLNGRDGRSPSANDVSGFREFPAAMRELPSHFFSRIAETEVHKRNLPHWGQDSVVCFVTFRLADSIPAAKLAQWQEEKEIWLRLHPEPWDEPTMREYVDSFPKRMEEWLDAGVGSCILTREDCRHCVAHALEHFNGERYILHSYVVMPNHVHVLFEISAKGDLARTVHAWKSFTAHALNKITGNVGAVWQSEYFDRLLRDSRHYVNTLEYIRRNWRSIGGRTTGGNVAAGTATGGTTIEGTVAGGTGVSPVLNGRDGRSPSINGRDGRSPSVGGLA